MTARSRVLGTVFVAAAIVFQALWLGFPAVFISVALLVSYGLWISGSWRFAPRLPMAFTIGVLVFVAHAAEEYLAGLPEALPALFGRGAWSADRWLAFNGVWLVVFSLAAVALTASRPLAVLVVLFFAIGGGVGNGVIHLALVGWRGAYFPGAWTAPLLLGVGAWLLRLLYAGPLPPGDLPHGSRGA